MAVTAKWYGKAFLSLCKGEVDWENDTIKVALTTSGYTPDQDADDYFDDVTDELAVDGYTAGGVALSTKSLAYTAVGNLCTLLADDASWSGALIAAARHAVVYKVGAGAASSPLLVYVDFGEDRSAYGGEFAINWADGVVAQAAIV